jgi:hypothetical protein
MGALRERRRPFRNLSRSKEPEVQDPAMSFFIDFTAASA